MATKPGKAATEKRMGLAKGLGCRKKASTSNSKRTVVTERDWRMMKVKPRTPTVRRWGMRLYLGRRVWPTVFMPNGSG